MYAQDDYQLSMHDMSIVNNFVSHVQALSADKPSQVSANISDIISRSHLSVRPYHVLSVIQKKLQAGLQPQIVTNQKLDIGFDIPQSRSVQKDDTEYGMVLVAPMHEQAPGIQTISIYKIHAKSGDDTLWQHIQTTQQHYQSEYSGYTTTGIHHTTIKSVPAISYIRSGVKPEPSVNHAGKQIVSLNGSKGITMTYTSMYDRYYSFVSIFDKIASQIK
jgi:hypothetical protein